MHVQPPRRSWGPAGAVGTRAQRERSADRAGWGGGSPQCDNFGWLCSLQSAPSAVCAVVCWVRHGTAVGELCPAPAGSSLDGQMRPHPHQLCSRAVLSGWTMHPTMVASSGGPDDYRAGWDGTGRVAMLLSSTLYETECLTVHNNRVPAIRVVPRMPIRTYSYLALWPPSRWSCIALDRRGPRASVLARIDLDIVPNVAEQKNRRAGPRSTRRPLPGKAFTILGTAAQAAWPAGVRQLTPARLASRPDFLYLSIHRRSWDSCQRPQRLRVSSPAVFLAAAWACNPAAVNRYTLQVVSHLGRRPNWTRYVIPRAWLTGLQACN